MSALKAIQNRHGAGLIIVIMILLVVGMIGAVLVSLMNSEVYSTQNQATGRMAMNISQGGMEQAVYQFKSGTSCAGLTNATPTSLGTGSFTIIGTTYQPVPTTLSAAVNTVSTTIPVVTVAGYAPHGRVTVDSEMMDYIGTSAVALDCSPFSPPCLTGVERGAAGTTTAAHAAGAPVPQDVCVIQSTGTTAGPLATARRVTETAVQTASSSSDFVNGVPTGFGAAQATIASLATSLPAGDNLIVATISLRNPNQVMTINAGDLRLQRGAAVLASNQNRFRFGDSPSSDNRFPQDTMFLVYKDVGAPANAAYSVTARTTNTNAGTQGAVRILAVGNVPNSSFLDGGSVAASNFGERTVLDHASNLPAGDNVVIAAVQLNTTNSDRTISAGNLRLRRGVGGPLLASNEFNIALRRDGNTRGNPSTGFLLLYRDAGAAANRNYTVTIQVAGGRVNAEAKMIVLNGLSSAFLDTGAVPIGTSFATIGALATTFPAGESVTIVADQFANPGGPAKSIAAGDEQLVADATTGSAFATDLCNSSVRCEDFASGLLWRTLSGAANPIFQTRARASAASINAESKIVAIKMPGSGTVEQIDWREIYP